MTIVSKYHGRLTFPMVQQWERQSIIEKNDNNVMESSWYYFHQECRMCAMRFYVYIYDLSFCWIVFVYSMCDCSVPSVPSPQTIECKSTQQTCTTSSSSTQVVQVQYNRVEVEMMEWDRREWMRKWEEKKTRKKWVRTSAAGPPVGRYCMYEFKRIA